MSGMPATAGGADSVADLVVSQLRAKLGGELGATSGTLGRTPGGESAVPLQVTVFRGNMRTGAFGAAVVPGGSGYPQGWLFLTAPTGTGTKASSGARVAFEDESGFAGLAVQSPVLSARERQLLGAAPAASPKVHKDGVADYRTGLRLPYAVGQSWSYTGGPHPMSGNPLSSIDLAGGDGRVLAAGDGVAYTMCASGRGWVRVVHEGGLATDYYHLSGNISAQGDVIREGDFLGNIGTDVSCGGSASGPHVHFSLRRDGKYIPIDRYAFGKWVIRSDGNSYSGYALHGSRTVNVGGALFNYGALGMHQGIVDTDGGTTLYRRSGPGETEPLLGSIADGETVTVVCSAQGSEHAGRGGYKTTLWDKLDDGGWVSDAFLWTGTGDPVAGSC